MLTGNKIPGIKDDWQSQREYANKTVTKALSGAKTLEDVLDGGLRQLFKKVLPKQVAADLCKIVTRLGDYTYDPSSYRRSFRSGNPADYYSKIRILVEEIYFDWKKFDLQTYLKMDSAQIQEESYQSPNSLTISMLLALKIDQDDKGIIDTIRDIILSENNTRVVSHELIRAVAMSHNEELHELMRDLLLAAKLQEGLRQAILETADDGVLDYFKLMIKTVLENDLLRFSSALRAVCVWMGLGYDYSDKRVVEKLLKLGYGTIEDKSARTTAIGSADVTQMYAGMWADSVFSIQSLNAHIKESIRGEKYQKLVGAYFLHEAGSHESGVRLAGETLGETDMDVLTLILASYSLTLYNVSEGFYSVESEKKITHDKYPQCLKDTSTRDRDFSRLAQIFDRIPKDGYAVSGKPFDWCTFSLTRSTVYGIMMALAAYDFDPVKHQRLMELFPLAESNNQNAFLNYFIARDINGGNRAFLFECLSAKSMPVRIRAAHMLKGLTLDEPEICKVEDLLALRTGEIRQTALEVIRNAGDTPVQSSIKRLLSNKNDNKRLAALDLLSSAKKSGKIAGTAMEELFATMPKTTEAEAIIIKSLTDSTPEYSEANGFGLYDPAYFPVLPPVERNKKYDMKAFRTISAKDMMTVFDSLLGLIEEHKDYEYKAVLYYGSADHILGTTNHLDVITDAHRNDNTMDDYVLGEVWRSWFEKNRENLLVLIKISYCVAVCDYHGSYELDYKPFARDLIRKKLGFDEIDDFLKKRCSSPYHRLANSIIGILLSKMDRAEIFTACHGILSDFFLSVPKEDWGKPCYDKRGGTYYQDTKLVDLKEISFFANRLNAGNDEEYRIKLALAYAIGAASDARYAVLGLEDVAYATQHGIIKKEELRRAVMGIKGTHNLRTYTGTIMPYAKETAAKYPFLLECVEDVVKRVIEIELRRGDTKTPVSELANAVERHEGAEVFAEILAALGKETLARGYVWGGDYTKREVLSSLLKASVPSKNDNAETLRNALGSRVSEKRLLEAAMYAPSWISIVQDYLGWEGLKSAAWYFHAHTRGSYSPEFETEVARFSPIDKEDFQRGAFDIVWFKEAYGTLGTERFGMLYDCAKYIAEGGAHRRAQLFADAVLGKLSIDDLETRIRDKRNKDLLLAYSLIPFGANQTRDALGRYEFINEFLKKSREFGAQRQASEKDAATIALENLARNLGYADVLRFNWKMEMEKLDAIQDYFKPHTVGETTVGETTVGETTLFLEMGDSGLAELIVDKAGKRLKSVPAAIKKEAYVKEINEVKASLKAQFSRARASLEKAMENQDTFSFSEISDLLGHPVISPILTKLVFRWGDELGFLNSEGLVCTNDTEITLAKDSLLTIAHCRDFFTLGKWLDYQRYAFSNSLIQPFKQIFRELYTVNEDEKSEKTISRRYAGHQIQPKKTVALLKGRGWTVDYENGLQKVYYKENVVASMYALADWFSPGDVEAPTLETVRFHERKTGKPLELETINPVLFSEVMRDVDLVVSVAHVGGVDPMASHSTMEMRAVIVTESARLLKLSNVTVGDHHARITGTLGEYSVHLGSGLAHMMGRGALNILPVHSQHRGRLFLPFMDEDPKTAEIVSKVLLLAEDTKIKDPSVMVQIRG